MDPRGLLRTLGRAAELADPAALSSASLRTAWRWDGEVLRLDDLEARVDDARVTGAITVSSFDPPALWFDLDADTLDLDRYATVGDGTAPGAAPSALRTAWLGGRLRVARVRSGGLEIEELELPFTLQGGVIALDGASARLLGGSVRGDLSAQLGDEPPRYRIRAQAMDLDLARMIEASGSGREVSGRLDLDLDLLTAGRDRTAMVASLDGRACVTARAGEMPLVRREGLASEWGWVAGGPVWPRSASPGSGSGWWRTPARSWTPSIRSAWCSPAWAPASPSIAVWRAAMICGWTRSG